METGWKPPLRYRRLPQELQQQLRDALRIVCDGQSIPPPIPSFAGEARGTWHAGARMARML